MDTRVTTAVENRVAAALAAAGVTPAAKVLVALSGGPDSVALIHALTRLGRVTGAPLVAAHLNHRMRPVEADRDENFVRALCAKLGIELMVEDAAGLAAGGNLEERARRARHEFLARAARHFGAEFIALAHNRDDQAETVLMRLMRGAGIAGLAAIAPSRPDGIIRPLLAVSRARILAYLAALGAAYVSDSTNLAPRFLRNRLRHELIPILERDYAPGLTRRLAGLASELRDLDEFLAAAAAAELSRRRDGSGRLDLAGFGALPVALAAAVIREWLRGALGDLRRVNRYQIDLMRELCANGITGTVAALPGGWRMRLAYGIASLEQIGDAPDAPKFAIPLVCPGVTVAPATGMRFAARIFPDAALEFASNKQGSRHTYRAWFDADAIHNGLIVRNFTYGDRIAPLGMTGTRKVQDLFVDRKTPRSRRAAWPMVVADGAIVWIPGLMRGRHGLITPATRAVLEIEAQPTSEARPARCL